MNAWPDRQGGAVTLIGALFIIITLALMVEVLQRMAASDVLDTAVQSDAVAALFIAETGIEHTSYLYANGTSCGDLSLLNNIAVGRGHFDITASALVGSDCQIQVRGTVATFAVQRVLEASLQSAGNLLANANADFNDPPGTCWPFFGGCSLTGWTFIPAPTLLRPAWDDTGGPDGSRAAYAWKIFNGGSTATTGGSFALQPFTVTAPTILTLNFDYRVVTSGGSSQEVQLSFNLSDGVNTYPASPAPFKSGNTGSYTPGSVTFTIGGSGAFTFTGFDFSLFAKSGRPKRIWLDNLDLRGPGGGAGVRLLQWREVVSN